MVSVPSVTPNTVTSKGNSVAKLLPKLNQLTFLPKLRDSKAQTDGTLAPGTKVRILSRDELKKVERHAPTATDNMFKYCGKICTLMPKSRGDRWYHLVEDDHEWSWSEEFFTVIGQERTSLLTEPRIDTRYQKVMETKLLERKIK
jgi:hypothetical protein